MRVNDREHDEGCGKPTGWSSCTCPTVTMPAKRTCLRCGGLAWPSCQACYGLGWVLRDSYKGEKYHDNAL